MDLGCLGASLPHVDDAASPAAIPPDLPLQVEGGEGGLKALVADAWLHD